MLYFRKSNISETAGPKAETAIRQLAVSRFQQLPELLHKSTKGMLDLRLFK